MRLGVPRAERTFRLARAERTRLRPARLTPPPRACRRPAPTLCRYGGHLRHSGSRRACGRRVSSWASSHLGVLAVPGDGQPLTLHGERDRVALQRAPVGAAPLDVECAVGLVHLADGAEFVRPGQRRRADDQRRRAVRVARPAAELLVHRPAAELRLGGKSRSTQKYQRDRSDDEFHEKCSHGAAAVTNPAGLSHPKEKLHAARRPRRSHIPQNNRMQPTLSFQSPANARLSRTHLGGPSRSSLRGPR